MTETANLTRQIEKQLPAELVDFLKSAGDIAASNGWRLYIVGGGVRDLLLGRITVDLDLVVEGDAVTLAQRLADMKQGKVVGHSRFGTATLRWDDRRIDLATARTETYTHPGALPTVRPGSLKDDLFRRDFTINAMAIELSPGRWGQLSDLYGGRDDLKRRLIRILHENSFVDDATRIWRAIRYEQRLDFKIEADTLGLLKRDLSYLDTISGDRIRHELELALKEEYPEKALRRAGELGVLSKLHPGLKGDGWLEKKFEAARQASAPERLSALDPLAREILAEMTGRQESAPSVGIYFALLTYRLTNRAVEELIGYLRPGRELTKMLRDMAAIKGSLRALAQPKLRPSRIHSLLGNFSPAAIAALSGATDSEPVRGHIQSYLSRLRYVRPALTGEELKRLGIPAGPQIRMVLRKLLEARLDGKVKSREEEERLVRRWVKRI